MANEPNDLLDFKVSLKKETSIADIFSQSKTAIKQNEGNVDVQNKILLATLDTVNEAGKLKEADLKTHLDELFSYLESVGIQFEGFKKLNDSEQKLIDDATRVKAVADQKLIDAQTALDTVKAIGEYSLFSPSTWWKSKKLAKANTKLTTAKTDQKRAEDGVKQAENDAESMFRSRLDKADMEQAMDHIAFITQKAIDQIKHREAEINESEADLLKVLEEGNKTHLLAVNQRIVAEAELEKEKINYQTELDLLNKITDQNSEAFTTKKQVIYVIEQKIEEWNAKINVCTAIAESKNSFEKKHNLALKTQTAQRGNLRAMRAKLQSDLDARASYYQSYLMIMKAGNDQKLSDYLEKIGVTTDENVGEVIAQMYVASSKTRQQMMEAIPLHNKRLMQILSALHTASVEIREKDEELKKTFDDFNKNSIHEEFDKSFLTTPTETGDEKPVISGGNNNGSSGAVNDLLQ